MELKIARPITSKANRKLSRVAKYLPREPRRRALYGLGLESFCLPPGFRNVEEFGVVISYPFHLKTNFGEPGAHDLQGRNSEVNKLLGDVSRVATGEEVEIPSPPVTLTREPPQTATSAE
jgi:hypothetical protein